MMREIGVFHIINEPRYSPGRSDGYERDSCLAESIKYVLSVRVVRYFGNPIYPNFLFCFRFADRLDTEMCVEFLLLLPTWKYLQLQVIVIGYVIVEKERTN